MRIDKRTSNQLRPVAIALGVNPYAEGSAEISVGRTKLLVTASVEAQVPKWLGVGNGGWITAEYGMLPRSTHTRNNREAATGKLGGRTHEIQRLIGRSLRQAVCLKELGEVTIKLDCDVICADGGTRTAAITAGWLALSQAIEWAKAQSIVSKDLIVNQVAAVSVGMLGGELLLDLSYEEDSQAEFDLNVVMNDQMKFIEIQGTAEKLALDRKQLDSLLELSQVGISDLFAKQQASLNTRGKGL
jgi:ribonuclease PH